ncbi:hypothetical protein WI91_12810 [Burkholderia vietnamiensis]|nr:hypothetical protein WI91_12810 [Burkholderia vietnamiensis]
MEKRIVFTADFERTPPKQQVTTLLASYDQRVVRRSLVETSAQCIDAEVHLHQRSEEVVNIGFFKLNLIWARRIQLFRIRGQKVPVQSNGVVQERETGPFLE